MRERNEEPAGFGINGVLPGGGECVVDGCSLPIPEDDLMCSPHWHSVPPGLKANLAFVMRRWRANDANLADLRTAQWACVDALEVAHG